MQEEGTSILGVRRRRGGGMAADSREEKGSQY